MIKVMFKKRDAEFPDTGSICDLPDSDAEWYWVDFTAPSEDEIKLLDSRFHFHPLAIEDCVHFMQRPKLDYYNDYTFFVFHALTGSSLEPAELDVFLGSNFIVSFHREPLGEISTIWERQLSGATPAPGQIGYIFHALLDKVVDNYFPSVFAIEDQLNQVEDATDFRSKHMIELLFSIRGDLLKLRRTILPMRDLLYQIVNSTRIKFPQGGHPYFSDIYDHLLRLSEIIESNREMTADIRDNYLSINSDRMNTVMMTLTIITTVFMPLTLIAGIYGMNFDYMPELTWRYGYFTVLGVMLAIGGAMFWWFKTKGWLD